MKKQNLKIIIIAIIILIVIISFIISNKNGKTFPFNTYSVAVVVSNSMKPNIKKNDVIIFKKSDDYKINDVIVYEKDDNLIVHRIKKINDVKVITKGDNNYEDDEPVLLKNIKGKVLFIFPYIGILIMFFKSNYTFIALFLLLIILFVIMLIKEMKKNNKGVDELK